MVLLNIVKKVVALSLVILPQTLWAFPTDHFASNSKLASGNWVKIKIGDTGLYQITNDELKEMGFSDPSKVKVFGKGGFILAQHLSSNTCDDLNQVPTLRTDNKIIFYGNGSTAMGITMYKSYPYFNGTTNCYSKDSYYFLTDDSKYNELTVPVVDATGEPTELKTTAYDYVYHNVDLTSLARSGKLFVGEDMIDNKSINFNINMPGLSTDSYKMLVFNIAGSVSRACPITALWNNEDIKLGSDATLKTNGDSELFKTQECYMTWVPTTDTENANLTINVANNGISLLNFDYFALTYNKLNQLPATLAQTRLAFDKFSSESGIQLSGLNSDMVLWNVTDSVSPIQYKLNINEAGEAVVTPGETTSFNYLMLFNPTMQLNSIVSSVKLANQDLHSLQTPDMVIITSKLLDEQARRIAKLHEEKDNMEVLVVDQEDIFNEFSSGSQDATAYRSFLKMLYDRNPSKLKYLLLFGCGSYDNRGLANKKSETQILTYESDLSNHDIYSYVTDDYFCMLGDNAGVSIPSDQVMLRCGRIPATSVADAKNAVDKIISYEEDDDFSIWHSNALLIADEGNDDLHMFQAEGINQILTNNANNCMTVDKAYVPWFGADANGVAIRGTEKIANSLTNGRLFTTYIGHAGSNALTKSKYMWNKPAVSRTHYPHYPFFSLAACGTSKFDDNLRSICEEMILVQNGGAINTVAATRTVYSSQNDELNKSLTKNMFCYNTTGAYTTIGDAYMKAKNSFGYSNINKLNFVLLGDPAIKVRYPLPLCEITSINDTNVANDTVTLNQSTKATVSGVVKDKNGNIDNNFNGKVTLVLYDKQVLYKTLVNTYDATDTRDSYYPREELCVVSGNVANGKFTLDITVPQGCKANDESVLLKAYAVSTENKIVGGVNGNIMIAPFDDEVATADTENPLINKITVNNIPQGEDIIVGANSVLNIEATDNFAISTMSNSINGGSKVIIDGKNVISPIAQYVTISENGTKLIGNIDMNDMAPGKHTAQFVVYDVAGNSATANVNFTVVDDQLEGTLTLNSDVARKSAEFELDTEATGITKIAYYVKDALGNVVRYAESNDISYKWDMKDNNGKRVKPGKYYCYSIFQGSTGYGITPRVQVVVIGK